MRKLLETIINALSGKRQAQPTPTVPTLIVDRDPSIEGQRARLRQAVCLDEPLERQGEFTHYDENGIPRFRSSSSDPYGIGGSTYDPDYDNRARMLGLGPIGTFGDRRSVRSFGDSDWGDDHSMHGYGLDRRYDHW
jgi:hypothetical protein